MDDWQIGDLALCVSDDFGAGFAVGWEPKVGGVYQVAGFEPQFNGTGWLDLIEDPDCGNPYGAWEPSCFRKIRPLTDEERDSFLADLDAPVFTPEPSKVAPADAALNARVGDFSPLGALPGSLPGPFAVDTSRHADGSGLLFNRAHAVEVPNG